jgi:hypothetical protein
VGSQTETVVDISSDTVVSRRTMKGRNKFRVICGEFGVCWIRGESQISGGFVANNSVLYDAVCVAVSLLWSVKGLVLYVPWQFCYISIMFVIGQCKVK